nr:hypothetical protein GCM10020185_27230 [Pseudomonas brassicacearum subsp. brassicacearum]
MAGLGGHRGNGFEVWRQFPDKLWLGARLGLRSLGHDNLGRWRRITRFGHLAAFENRQTGFQREQALLGLLQQDLLLGRLATQAPQSKRLGDAKPHQRAYQRIGKRLVHHPAECQAQQRQDPLHGRYP